MRKLSLTKHAVINNIARSVCYGLEWLRDDEKDDLPAEAHRVNLAKETLAHMMACRVCQELLDKKQSVETGEMAILIKDSPDPDTLEKRLVQYYNGYIAGDFSVLH